jgi:hypothetical protein
MISLHPVFNDVILNIEIKSLNGSKPKIGSLDPESGVWKIKNAHIIGIGVNYHEKK